MERKRKGDWIQCRSGKPCWPLDPRPEDIDIEDIAHALSNICRFTGQCLAYYSVAQHSVHVAEGTSGAQGLWHLLHDAAEAYLGDISQPLKRYLRCDIGDADEPLYLPSLSSVENTLLNVIGQALELPPCDCWPAIHQADSVLLATEAHDLMQPLHPGWAKWLADFTPRPQRIWPWEPEYARRRFLERYHELKREL